MCIDDCLVTRSTKTRKRCETTILIYGAPPSVTQRRCQATVAGRLWALWSTMPRFAASYTDQPTSSLICPLKTAVFGHAGLQSAGMSEFADSSDREGFTRFIAILWDHKIINFSAKSPRRRAQQSARATDKAGLPIPIIREKTI